VNAKLSALHDVSGRTAEAADFSLSPVLDMQMMLTMEIGRTRISIRRLLELATGSIIELDRSPADTLDVYANGRLIAKAEVVAVNRHLAMRFADVATQETVGASR
jgi:flagellar motor switch protein FliN/FliY